MEEKLLKIINTYGVMPQLKYFQSEIFELNEAIIRYEELQEKALAELDCYPEWNDEYKKHIAEEIISDIEKYGYIDAYVGWQDCFYIDSIVYHLKQNAELQQRINKAIHRIQLLQMDNEVTVRDLGLIARDLKGDKNECDIS